MNNYNNYSSISNKDSSKPIIVIHSKTWSKETHGLFDYESVAVKRSLALIQGNSTIIRKKNDVKEEDICNLDVNDSLLFNIRELNGDYHLINPVESKIEVSEDNINLLMNKIWYVLPSLTESNDEIMVATRKNKEYPIKPYDVIKLGRVKYSVNEIFFTNDCVEINQEPVFDFLYTTFTPESNYECRYCLTNTNDEKNPLVSLCKCKGGAMFIHYTCVKQWMSMKLSTKENTNKSVISYNFKSFNCEICKWPYPFRFTVNNNMFNLIEINKPIDKNYMILESLNQVKDNNNYKSIHVILLENNKELTLGRSNETDVRINDISVSRIHAYLRFKDKQIFLYDNNSKFGTLILMRTPVDVTSIPLSLQIGRTYITINKTGSLCKNFNKLLKIKNSGGHHNKLGAMEVLYKKQKENDDNFEIKEITEDINNIVMN